MLDGFRTNLLARVAALFVLAAVGAAVADAASEHDGTTTTTTTQPATTTLAETTATPTTTTAPQATTTQSTLTVVPTTTAAPATTTEPPPTPEPTGDLAVWPPAGSGYTVVLVSVPTSRGKAAAARIAHRAIAAGLSAVGVLDSSGFSSLHPGYYVVFSGRYHAFTGASGALSAATNAGFRNAYVRLIAP
jgi:hypothetical protein